MPSLRVRSKKQVSQKEQPPEPPPEQPAAALTRRSTRISSRLNGDQSQDCVPQSSVTINVSPSTAQTLSSRTPVVRLQRVNVVGVSEQPPAEPEVENQARQPRRKKRLRIETEEVEENEGGERNMPQETGNVLLPPVNLFPSPTDQGSVVTTKLKELRDSVIGIFGYVFDQVQADEDSLIPCYQSVQNVFEYFEIVSADWGEDERSCFGAKYRNVCVYALYSFGAVVWKHDVGRGIANNQFAGRVSTFMEYCFMHLGWKVDRKFKKGAHMKEWKDKNILPAAYYTMRLFNKYHADKEVLCRQHQLQLVNKLLEVAYRSENDHFIKFVWETVGAVVLIRVKDRSAPCRVLALKILSYFVGIENAAASCQKELKYYTRYDPYDEVRRLGTKVLGDKTRIKLRFFFDQAFDKKESVRVEAFKAMGVMIQGDEEVDMLVRDMEGLASEKLCKVIVWGAMHSGVKCREIIKSEVLPKWLRISCKSDIVQFLANIDAYQHMKAVVRILDMLLTTQEQERFVESIDLTFIETLKENVLARNYKAVTIESFVAWLGLCKASNDVESIKGRVVPETGDMLKIIEALHECVFREHEEAKAVARNEDITPVFCLVIALEISKGFVCWEEGTRAEMVQAVKEILLDPLLDDRVVVIQAINTLQTFVGEAEFEDGMMEVFQEVFDARSGFDRTGGSFREDVERVGENEGEEGVVVEEAEVEGERGEFDIRIDDEEEEEDVDRSGGVVVVEGVVEKVPLNTFQITKMKSELCDLGLERIKLQRDRDQMMKDKLFIDTIPINLRINDIIELEGKLGAKIKEEEEFAKEREEVRKRGEERVVVEREEVRKRGEERVVVERVDENEEDGMREEGDMEEEEEDRVMDKTAIISSVEEGLAKGMFMINAFLDLCPKMGAFVRNLYDSHIPGFMMESDINIRMSVLQFLARIAIIDKRELRKVFCFLVKMMLSVFEIELRNIAFQCIVDLVVCYEYHEFCMRDHEINQPDEMHPYKMDMSRHLSDVIPGECEDYTSCTPELMEKFVLEVLTQRFPPALDHLSPAEINILSTCKNVGLLKLLVRGRLRDPVIIANVLCLWANHEYAGTAVLRDLEHVVKLYRTFEWWDVGGRGDGFVVEIPGEIQDDVQRSFMMRVLGVAVGEGVLMLCQDSKVYAGGKDGEDIIFKFVSFFLSFLEVGDQPLMRTISGMILNPVSVNPTRSYNNVLVRCASRIPITSNVSALWIVKLVNEIFGKISEHPATPSMRILRKELLIYLNKLKRLFGEQIAVIKENGRDIVVGREIGSGDDEEGVEDEEQVSDEKVCSFNEEEGEGSNVE